MPGTATPGKVTQFKVDFTDIGGAGYGPGARVPKGEYLLECVDAEVRVKRGDENKPSARQSKMVAFVWRIIGGNGRGVVYENANIVLFDEKGIKKDPKKYLWVLRQRLNDMFAGEKEFEQKGYGIDLTKVIGRRIGASLDDGNPYTKQNTDGSSTTTIRSEIQGSYPAAEWERLYANTDNPNAPDTSAAADEADDDSDAPVLTTVPVAADDETPDADAETANPGSDDDLDDLEVEDM